MDGIKRGLLEGIVAMSFSVLFFPLLRFIMTMNQKQIVSNNQT